MNIRNIIKEELKTVKYSDLHNWGNEKPVRTNMKVSPKELLTMLGDDYDKMLSMIEKIYGVFAKKIVVKAGLLPEDIDVIESSLVNNHLYAKNEQGSYEPTDYDYGQSGFIFDNLKTIQSVLGGVPFGDINKGGYYGDDFRDVLYSTAERLADENEQIEEDLNEMIDNIEDSDLMNLYLSSSPDEIVGGYLSDIKNLEDQDLAWIRRGHSDPS